MLGLFLLSINLVSAAHTADVTLVNYTSFYETQNTNFSLRLEQIFNSTYPDFIRFINLSIPTDNLEIISYDYPQTISCSNNDYNSNPFIINCSGIGSYLNQYSLNITARVINTDMSITFDIFTTDEVSITNQNTIQLSLYNDATSPILSNLLPGNITNNSNSQPFSLDVNDPETGIDSGILSYGICGSSYDNKSLTCTNSDCNTDLDISSYNDEDEICYYFTIYNNGGSESVSDLYQVIIDRSGPGIDLSNLESLNDTNDDDGIIDFDYPLIDPSGIKNCSLILDNNLVNTTSTDYLSYVLTSSNDPYNFYIECYDNLENENSTPIYIIYYDDIAPVISNIATSVTTSSGTITFSTDELANKSINYGINILNSITSDNSMLSSHSIIITGLNSSTIYNYTITVRDRWSNEYTTPISSFRTDDVVYAPASSGGGGGSSCTTDWTCLEWSSCENNIQTCTSYKKSCNKVPPSDVRSRSCVSFTKPTNVETVESRNEEIFQCNDGLDNDNDNLVDENDSGCIVDGKYLPLKNDEYNEEGLGITGAFLNVAKTGGKYSAYVLLFLMLSSLIYYIYRNFFKYPKVEEDKVTQTIQDSKINK